MASFYICHQHPTPNIIQSQHQGPVDASSACKILRKTAIKLHQVPAKLEITKVIRFLENLTNNNQNIPGYSQISKEKNRSQQSHRQGTPEQISHEDRPHTIMQISTTKSLMSAEQLKQEGQNESIYKQLTNMQFQKEKIGSINHSNKENWSGLMQNFKWREVVTKNALDQTQGNRRVRFRGNSIRQIQNLGQNSKIMQFQLLKDQNERLRKYIVNIFQFFHSKQILQLPTPLPQLQLSDIESISNDLFGTLEKREVEIEFERKKLMQVQSEYLLTLKNISIDLRIEASQLKPNQTSIVHRQMTNSDIPLQNLETRVKQLVTITSKIQEMNKQMQSLKQKIKQKQEEIKKYEMLLFIKEQEISSLRVINSDLENKLSKLTKVEERPRSTRSKSYKKYFEHLDENMSSTFS